MKNLLVVIAMTSWSFSLALNPPLTFEHDFRAKKFDINEHLEYANSLSIERGLNKGISYSVAKGNRPLNFFSDEEKKKWYQTRAWNISIAPASFLIASGLVWNNREDIRDTRNRFLPDYETSLDDLTRYIPMLLVYGLNIGGVDGQNKVDRATVALGIGTIINVTLFGSLKTITKVERPDESEDNSYPSGHTAFAFQSAMFLDYEYGRYRSPVYSFVGYATAIATGVMLGVNSFSAKALPNLAFTNDGLPRGSVTRFSKAGFCRLSSLYNASVIT